MQLAEQQLSEKNTRIAAMEAECLTLRRAVDGAEERLRKRIQEHEANVKELQQASNKILSLENTVAELSVNLESSRAQYEV